MRISTALAAACIALGGTAASPAQEVTRHERAGSMLLQSVEVGPGARYLYIGGHAAALLDPADRAQGYGDTKTQTISTLRKMQGVLEAHGYKMSDMIKMNIFVVADPKLGKPDYEGVNAGFKQFFQTKENPNTVVRTAVEITAIQLPGLFVEIEGVAAR